jgi:hypothetical protein
MQNNIIRLNKIMFIRKMHQGLLKKKLKNHKKFILKENFIVLLRNKKSKNWKLLIKVKLRLRCTRKGWSMGIKLRLSLCRKLILKKRKKWRRIFNN